MESPTSSTLTQEEQPEWQFAQDLVKVFARDPTEDDNQITRAIRIRRTDVLEYLVKPYECDVLSCLEAALVGRVDYLQLLHRNQHPWDEEVCIFAVKRNHLDCLQYLCTNGCPWDQRAYYYATKFHILDCMKYAREQDLPWNDNVSYYIAEAGNLTMLKYAADHGCPLNEQNVAVQIACAICLNLGALFPIDILGVWYARRAAFPVCKSCKSTEPSGTAGTLKKQPSMVSLNGCSTCTSTDVPGMSRQP